MKKANRKQNSRDIPSGSNCVDVIVAEGVLSSKELLFFLRESSRRLPVQRLVETVWILRLYVAFTSKLSLSLFLLAELVVQACVRVSWVCTEVIVIIELGEIERLRSGR